MSRKRPLTKRGVEKLSERERSVGMDPEDQAARWLEENEPKPELPPSKSASKSKALHQWRRKRASGG